MLDWSKFLKVLELKDAPEAIRQLMQSMPDNMLLNIFRKSIERKHDQLTPYLLEEIKNRGLIPPD